MRKREVEKQRFGLFEPAAPPSAGQAERQFARVGTAETAGFSRLAAAASGAVSCSAFRPPLGGHAVAGRVCTQMAARKTRASSFSALAWIR